MLLGRHGWTDSSGAAVVLLQGHGSVARESLPESTDEVALVLAAAGPERTV